MSRSELSTKNYKRIFFINALLVIPFLMLFAWPYLVFCELLHIPRLLSWLGASLFSIPFMLTILHGHVTLALGSAHRHHFYNWLKEKPLTYGLFFNPMFIRTRFRLVLLVMSLLLLVFEYALNAIG